MKVRHLTDDDRKRWDSFVMESDTATCYHLAGWKDVIEQAFGHKTYYLLAEDADGLIAGVIPLVQLKSALFGNFMVSLPYFNYGGICVHTEDAADSLLKKAADLAAGTGATHIEFRQVGQLAAHMPVKTTKVSMHRKLPSTSDDLWNSLASKLRSQIQRPIKENMYATVGRTEELESFYAVFSENMRDLGTPVYGIDFFRAILNKFPEHTWISTVYTDSGKPVASGFLVGFRDSMEIPWASSLRSYNRCSPNMLLYWNVLKFAADSGYRSFDFGRSTPGEGTYKFKKQWGAQPRQLYWYYWLKNGQAMPELNPRNPKYRMAIQIWKKMPVSLTRLIGPAIVKNLP